MKNPKSSYRNWLRSELQRTEHRLEEDRKLYPSECLHPRLAELGCADQGKRLIMEFQATCPDCGHEHLTPQLVRQLRHQYENET